MIRYALIKEEPDGNPPFEIFRCMMHDESMCVGEHERKVRALLMWLNERGALYHIAIREPEPPKPSTKKKKMTSYEDIYDLYDMFHVGKRHRPVNEFDLFVDTETATLMKLFFEEFEAIIPEPEPEPEPVPEPPPPPEPPEPVYTKEWWLARALRNFVLDLFCVSQDDERRNP